MDFLALPTELRLVKHELPTPRDTDLKSGGKLSGGWLEKKAEVLTEQRTNGDVVYRVTFVREAS